MFKEQQDEAAFLTIQIQNEAYDKKESIAAVSSILWAKRYIGIEIFTKIKTLNKPILHFSIADFCWPIGYRLMIFYIFQFPKRTAQHHIW